MYSTDEQEHIEKKAALALLTKAAKCPEKMTDEEWGQVVRYSAKMQAKYNQYNDDILKDYNTYKDVQEYLGVTRNTIYLYTKQGKLHPIKTKGGRVLFAKEDIKDFLNKRDVVEMLDNLVKPTSANKQ